MPFAALVIGGMDAHGDCCTLCFADAFDFIPITLQLGSSLWSLTACFICDGSFIPPLRFGANRLHLL